MNKIKHFIVISITIFMMVDIGLKISILDTLDKKRIVSQEQETLAYAKNSKRVTKKSISSIKNTSSKSTLSANQKSALKTSSARSAVKSQVPTQVRSY